MHFYLTSFSILVLEKILKHFPDILLFHFMSNFEPLLVSVSVVVGGGGRIKNRANSLFFKKESGPILQNEKNTIKVFKREFIYFNNDKNWIGMQRAWADTNRLGWYQGRDQNITGYSIFILLHYIFVRTLNRERWSSIKTCHTHTLFFQRWKL